MNTESLSMSPKIAAAIVAVAKSVRRLAKDGTNEHGKYMFTSVDKFYEAIGPMMADAGLFTLANLTRAETFEVVGEVYGKEKKISYLNMEFDIFLVHESGDMSTPIKREVTVVASGPQSYASAESFVTKYFIRNLFKVPTGEHDADSDEKTELPTMNKRQPAKHAAKKEADAEQRQQGQPAKMGDDSPSDDAGKTAKLKPVLEFVATVNAFLDTGPDAAALFAYEGGPGVNARMKRIRSNEFSAVPAVQELLRRINAIYATAPDSGDAE